MRQTLLIIFTIFSIVKSQAQNWIPHTFTELNNKVGYIDSVSGETKVFWHFDSAKVFKYGLATACFQGKWGCFNTKGEIIVPFAFSSLELISDTSAEVDWDQGWLNEIFYFKGQLKNRVVTYSVKSNAYLSYSYSELIDIDERKLTIVIINSESEQRALQVYHDELVLSKLKQSTQLYKPSIPRFWQSLQLSTFSFNNIGNQNGVGTDLKTGFYYRQKFILTGFNIGYQRSRITNDTFKYLTHQIPFVWSNYFFLKKNPLGNALYTKLDLGCILGTFDFKENKQVGTAYKSSSSRNMSAPNIIMNIGFGFKISQDNAKTGFTFETGYKFAPIVIANRTYINHAYVSLGVLL